MTRTMDGPMAFTRDDFLRGAGWALGSFLALLLAAEILLCVADDLLRMPNPANVTTLSSTSLLPLVLGYTVGIGGPIAALCLVVGSPVAYGLARAMRHETRIIVHIIAFALFGALFGALCGAAACSMLFAIGSTGSPWPGIAAVGAIGAAFTAAATVIGWTIASRGSRNSLTNLRARPAA